MTSEVNNFFTFSLQSREWEQQAYDAAIDIAEQLAGTNIRMLNHTSRRICTQAFETFKRNMEKTFSSDPYKDLIILTLRAREGLFFVDLKERVIIILKKQ
ncbi:MAG: hypothetical protein KR126chlam3_01089 [Chlamydiae bacterium]|nr:hypothetical protein [Chlamydiota bacterium]